MIHRCHILLSLVFVVFTKIGRVKLAYEVVGCLYSLQSHYISFIYRAVNEYPIPMHESSHCLKMHFQIARSHVSFSAFIAYVTHIAALHQSRHISIFSYHKYLQHMWKLQKLYVAN